LFVNEQLRRSTIKLVDPQECFDGKYHWRRGFQEA